MSASTPIEERFRSKLSRSPHGRSSSSAQSGETVVTSSTTTMSDFFQGTERGMTEVRGRNLAAMLKHLPSSPKELLQTLERQREEMRLLQDENTRLKSREVEVSALTLRLQQQFSATQSQVDSIKMQIRTQLLNPVTDDEYAAIENMPESKRDILDSIKLGIYQQLGSMRASCETATRRAAELASAVAKLTDKNNDLQLQLTEAEAVGGSEKATFERKIRELEKQAARVVELEASVRDLEGKLRNAFIDQEQFLTAKLTAQVKTDECARLAVRLEEAEMERERYRASAECSEQKLDILKSEYYELKLKNGQRVLELEGCLKASEEKLKTLGDLEMESELFISNLAQQSDGSGQYTLIGGSQVGSATAAGSSYESWMALPRSRKLAHTLLVTKRCLHLENKVTALQHDLDFKDKQISRLQVSLSVARDALNNVNSPYSLVEKAMSDVMHENDKLKEKVGLLEGDNALLKSRLEERTADVNVLCKHRAELMRIRKLLHQLGVREEGTFEKEVGGAPASAGLQRRSSDTGRSRGGAPLSRVNFSSVPGDGAAAASVGGECSPNVTRPLPGVLNASKSMGAIEFSS